MEVLFRSPRYLITIGILFHCLYVFSIFDIYFRSPLVHGMTPHEPNSPPLAERLVLFVADGLRADKIFEKSGESPNGQNLTRAPFLHSMAQHGRWGVSHAHVPTESRPGHVALIAGFYEDVSAVTRGWKTNPVEFDSFFNHSSHCWAWGSPDILPMFSLSIPHMYGDSYPSEFEDFGKEASHLDTWVFERLQTLITSSRNDTTLYKKLHAPKVVFFLHLLGIDTNGHGYRPYSPEYLHNIEIVDSGIEQTYHMLERFFHHDGKTSYIFTADHGMSNKGSHGDSHPTNTLTPLIAWGAGIASGDHTSKPFIFRNTPDFDVEHEEWPLAQTNNRRLDVEQGDVAMLMSSLLGTPFPMNAVGVTPTEYLDCSIKEKAEILFTNAQQSHEQFKRKSELKQSTALFFTPFTKQQLCTESLSNIPAALASKKYEEAISLATTTIQTSAEGLHYLQTYDWSFLMSIITIGFLGWIIVLSLFIFQNYSQFSPLPPSLTHSDTPTPSYVLFGIIYSIIGVKLFVEGAPLIYFAYAFFPVFFWCLVFIKRSLFIKLAQDSIHSMRSTSQTFVITVVTLVLLEILVFSFFQRSVLSLCLLCIGFFSVYQTGNLGNIFMYLVMALFPLLPVDLGNDIRLVCAGGMLLLPVALLPLGMSWYNSKYPRLSNSQKGILLVQLLLIFLALLQVYVTHIGYIVHSYSWYLCYISLLLPLFSDSYYIYRAISMFIGFGVPYILLSINYEVLYYLCFGILLYKWHEVEIQQHVTQVTRIRLSVFYLVFYFVAFFGTGNVASISSFEISSTYRFVQIFDPFLMGSLLIFKMFIPFILVCCCYILISRGIRQPELGSLFTVISMSDVIAITFFFLVQDSGSWKDIGVSIGHYIVACAFIVIQLGLFCVSQIYLFRTHQPPKLHIQ